MAMSWGVAIAFARIGKYARYLIVAKTTVFLLLGGQSASRHHLARCWDTDRHLESCQTGQPQAESVGRRGWSAPPQVHAGFLWTITVRGVVSTAPASRPILYDYATPGPI